MIDKQACLIKVAHPEVDFKNWQKMVSVIVELYNAVNGTIIQ